MDRYIIWACMLILLSCVFLLFFVEKKRINMVICYFFVSLIAILCAKSIKEYYGIYNDYIDFYKKQKEYRKMIDGTPSRNKPGEPKLVIIELPSRYSCTKRYLVYDESDKVMDEDNHYYGLGCVYATWPNGKRFHSSDQEVRVRKYNEHIYLADVGFNYPCEPD